MKPDEQKIALLGDRLSRFPGLVCAFLIGSGARGRLRPQSDLDVALLFRDRPPATEELLGLAAELESLAGRVVHLGVLSCDNLIYATEVYQGGRELFCLDEDFRDTFFMQLLSAYVDFNYARRDVLEAYLVREDAVDEYSAE